MQPSSLRVGVFLTLGFVGTLAFAKDPSHAPPGSGRRDLPGRPAASADHHGGPDLNPGHGPGRDADHEHGPDGGPGHATDGDDAARAPRAERARNHRAELKARCARMLHGQPVPPGLKVELEAHARRVARLERIRQLASAAKDTDAVTRVDALLSKEHLRHERALTDFEHGPSVAGPAGSAR